MGDRVRAHEIRFISVSSPTPVQDVEEEYDVNGNRAGGGYRVASWQHEVPNKEQTRRWWLWKLDVEYFLSP